MKVILYSFKKRRNSTARPGGGTEFDCILKKDTTVSNPAIELNVGVTTNMSGYNYAQIPDFQRYYYVEWEYKDSLWVAHCTVDVMATLKGDIGAANLYILRAANAYNTTIIDSNYAITSQTTSEVKDGMCPWIRYDSSSAGGSTGGFYVVGIAGAGDDGAVTYYGMDKLYFQQFCKKLYNTTDWLNIDWDEVVGISEQVLKALVNPGQYIVSAKWYPLDVYGVGIPMTDTIKFGWWDLRQQCYIVNFPTLLYHLGTVNFPRHPQAPTLHGDYLDYKPYSYFYFYTAPFGIIEIDHSDYRHGDSIVNIDVLIDMITGEAELQFKDKFQKMVKKVKVPFAVDVPILQMTIDIGSALGSSIESFSGVLSGAGQIASGLLSVRPNYMVSSITGGTSQVINSMVDGIGGNISALNPQSSIINQQSSYADFRDNNWEFRSKHFMVSPLSRQNIGQVLAETRNVASLGGYMLPGEVGCVLGGNKEEANEARAIMSGGFYYE